MTSDEKKTEDTEHRHHRSRNSRRLPRESTIVPERLTTRNRKIITNEVIEPKLESKVRVGETPTPARETRALPIHLNFCALLHELTQALPTLSPFRAYPSMSPHPSRLHSFLFPAFLIRSMLHSLGHALQRRDAFVEQDLHAR